CKTGYRCARPRAPLRQDPRRARRDGCRRSPADHFHRVRRSPRLRTVRDRLRCEYIGRARWPCPTGHHPRRDPARSRSAGSPQCARRPRYRGRPEHRDRQPPALPVRHGSCSPALSPIPSAAHLISSIWNLSISAGRPGRRPRSSAPQLTGSGAGDSLPACTRGMRRLRADRGDDQVQRDNDGSAGSLDRVLQTVLHERGDWFSFRVSLLGNYYWREITPQLSSRFGLLRDEYVVLAYLVDYGELTANVIAAVSSRPKNSISRAVASLRAKG